MAQNHTFADPKIKFNDHDLKRFICRIPDPFFGD